jgi:hypothetical protein
MVVDDDEQVGWQDPSRIDKRYPADAFVHPLCMNSVSLMTHPY